MNTLQNAAIGYARLGLSVIPLKPRDKTPIMNDWPTKATTDEGTIRAWWRTSPDSNIGIVCGKSGLTVVDVDPRNGGDKAIEQINGAIGPDWQNGAMIADTGGGGIHYIFAVPEGINLPGKIGAGVDLLSGNRYFLASPSVHPSGNAYCWRDGGNPADALDLLPPLPAVLVNWANASATPVDVTSPAPVDVADALGQEVPPEETAAEVARVRSALEVISADCSRADYLTVLAGLKWSGWADAEHLAREWAERSEDGKYDERDFNRDWKSLKEARHDRKTTTLASVYGMAKAQGWDASRKTSKVTTPEKAHRFKLIHPDELRTLPPLRWRIKGVLPAVGVAAIFGPSASGKSFLAFDMAAAVADGCVWFGHRVKPAPVVYLPLEGEAGFRLRAAAWESHNARSLPEALALVLDPFKLVDGDDVKGFGLAVLSGLPGAEPLVIIDTLNRAAPDCDENASADMGRVIEGAKNLQRLTGGLVLLVHHTGKDAGRGMRGHSSLFAALDAAIEVTRDEDRRAWRLAKSKDGADGEDHQFRLQVYELGRDEDGDSLTSCAIALDDCAMSAPRPKPPQGGNQRIAYDALHPLLEHGARVTLESAIAAAAARLVDVEPARRRTRAKEAVQGLVARGSIGSHEGNLWLLSVPPKASGFTDFGVFGDVEDVLSEAPSEQPK